MTKLVSICMPVYNGATYLAEAMESCLEQSYKNIEVIVVNDGSFDSTDTLMQHYKKDKRVKYIKQSNKGISSARNRAIRASEGSYIAVMDADDQMHPQRIEKSLEAIKRVDVVYSSFMQCDESGKEIGGQECCPKVTKENILANSSAPHVTIMARRHCFTENKYESWADVNDDAVLLAKWFLADYKFKPIMEPLMMVRYHSKSVSRTRDRDIKKISKEVEKMLDV